LDTRNNEAVPQLQQWQDNCFSKNIF